MGVPGSGKVGHLAQVQMKLCTPEYDRATGAWVMCRALHHCKDLAKHSTGGTCKCSLYLQAWGLEGATLKSTRCLTSIQRSDGRFATTCVTSACGMSCLICTMRSTMQLASWAITGGCRLQTTDDRVRLSGQSVCTRCTAALSTYSMV